LKPLGHGLERTLHLRPGDQHLLLALLRRLALRLGAGEHPLDLLLAGVRLLRRPAGALERLL
jgi:hypothetical protein